MKVKVNIYSEKSIGSPLRTLIDPVIGEVETYEQLGVLISSAINNASPFLPDQELVTLVSGYPFGRWMDIVNLQTYLRNNGLVLMVTEITSDPIDINLESYYIEVVSPVMGMLPVSTTFYSESGQYDILSIVSEIVSKFNVGDQTLVPDPTIISMLTAIEDMQSKGMPIFPMYLDQIQNELANYGFQMYYVYNS